MSEAATSQILERPLPHSAEAERAILGAIILDPSLASEAAESLKAGDFYIRAHQLIFRAMLALQSRDVEINPILLGEELRRERAVETVGGLAYVSDLTFGMPLVTSLAPYVRLVRETSLLRRIAKVANNISSSALESGDDPAAVLNTLREAVASLEEEHACFYAPRPSLVASFAEFMRASFDDGEEIAFHARRGELALVQSVTNHGKSTLIRNSALSLAVGCSFFPVVERGEARRVLLLNFEGSGGWFQNDIAVMTRDFTSYEIESLKANFHPTHAPLLDGEPLSLSRHLRTLERDIERAGGVDVIIIDTVSAAFSLRNENDNAEVANSVMKPLVRLARKLNCLIILVHHVGKAKAEEGATREQAHRGRGASACGDFSTSIFNLDADAQDQERVTLTCGKRKNGGNYERVLRLDRQSRWFSTTDETPAKAVTNDDLVLEAMERLDARGREVATGDIIDSLTGKVKKRTVMECLNRLANLGKAVRLRQGWWELPEVCASCATPYMYLHNCTNCVETVKPLSELQLHANAGVSPNGNGFHRSSKLIPLDSFVVED